MDLLRSLPIGLYLEQPLTWLHKIDARVKLAGLLSILLAPIAANVVWRLGIVLVLLGLTVLSRLPFRVWWRQMRLLLLFGLLLFVIALFAPDGINVRSQPRLPANEFMLGISSSEVNSGVNPGVNSPGAQTSPRAAIAAVPLPPATDYRYVLFEAGIFRVTRRSLELAIRTGTLIFTLLYSTTLFLLTTAPEEITAGLEDLLQPLRRFNLPVTELMLTLTLALRFIPLVLEEVQNLVRSIWTRAINWKKLGVRGTTQVWTSIAERLLDNLLLRAEQIANAMQVRGFTSPNQHRVKWHQSKLRRRDWVALIMITLFCGARMLWGN